MSEAFAVEEGSVDMPESYREYAEEAAEDQIRIERLEHELRTLQSRCAELQIERLKHQIKLQQAFNAAKASLLDYLHTQHDGVEENAIHQAVQAGGPLCRKPSVRLSMTDRCSARVAVKKPILTDISRTGTEMPVPDIEKEGFRWHGCRMVIPFRIRIIYRLDSGNESCLGQPPKSWDRLAQVPGFDDGPIVIPVVLR